MFEVQSLLVIDNLYVDPDEVRAHALNLSYRNDVFGEHFWRTPAQINLDIIPHLESYVGEKIARDIMWEIPKDPEEHREMNMTFYKVVNLEGHARANHIHHDCAHWSGILYLTPDLGPEYGTQFWRHKPSGDEYAFGDSSYNGPNEFDERCRIPEDFEKTDYISHKYNRLVLFRGAKYHSASFPSDMPDGERLNQFFYFNIDDEIMEVPDYRGGNA